MNHFLLPLLLGFFFALTSVFTSVWSRWLGERGGRIATNLLRNLLGIPLYMVGLVLAWRTNASPLFNLDAVTAIGWVLIAVGTVPVIIGHWQLGLRTHLPSNKDALMERGFYAHVRHPIYSGGLLIFAGLALLRPTLPWLLACVLAICFFIIQSRLEEIDLLQRISTYREYMNRVPRFLPRGLGKLSQSK